MLHFWPKMQWHLAGMEETKKTIDDTKAKALMNDVYLIKAKSDFDVGKSPK